MTRLFQATAACLVIFFVTTSVQAQLLPDSGADSASPGISVTGTHVVKRLPETFRVIVTLQAKGKTFDEALAILNNEKESALDKFQTLGVDKERIEFGNFGIDQLQENKQRQMEAMVAQRVRIQNQRKSVAAESIALKCTVSVDWPLAGTTSEEIFKESHALKQKIKVADFTAKKVALTPEEEEMMEEMAGMIHHIEQPGSDGGPLFIYVSKISDADAQTAYAEAFAEAVKQGEALAKATGFITMGKLTSISGRLDKRQQATNRNYAYGMDYHIMQMMHGQQLGIDGKDDSECLSANPDPVDFTFIINAVFAMNF